MTDLVHHVAGFLAGADSTQHLLPAALTAYRRHAALMVAPEKQIIAFSVA